MTTTNDTRVLRISEATRLATVIGWAQRNERLQWLNDRNELQTGTARSIGDEVGNFAGPNDDVRDCFLRITTSSGWEWFVPVSDVLYRVDQGTIAADR